MYLAKGPPSVELAGPPVLILRQGPPLCVKPLSKGASYIRKGPPTETNELLSFTGIGIFILSR